MIVIILWVIFFPLVFQLMCMIKSILTVMAAFLFLQKGH